jgi:hypothetical protein
MKAIELKIPEKVYRKLAGLAAHESQSVDEFALHKLEELLQAMDSFSELERRARRGSFAKFKAAMAKVPLGPSPVTRCLSNRPRALTYGT